MGLTKEFLEECFLYDKENGKLFWKERPESHFARAWVAKKVNEDRAGKEAGFDHDGYRRVRVGSSALMIHAIVYFFENGTWSEEIDHVNGVKDDNKIENLRSVSHAENMKNRRLNKNNKSGYPGVVWEKSKGLWAVRMPVNGKLKTLGRSKSLDRAIEIKKAGEALHGYHENHGKAA